MLVHPTDPETAFAKLLQNHIFQCEGAAVIDYAEQQQLMQDSQHDIGDGLRPFVRSTDACVSPYPHPGPTPVTRPGANPYFAASLEVLVTAVNDTYRGWL